MTVEPYGAPPAGATSFAPADEAVIAYLLGKGFPSVSDEGPDDIYPHIQVWDATGGESEQKSTATSQLDVHTFHPDPGRANIFARRVHYWISDLFDGMAGARVDYRADDGTPVTVWIDDVRTIQSPKPLVWDDEGHIRRLLAIYDIDSRRDSSTLL